MTFDLARLLDGKTLRDAWLAEGVLNLTFDDETLLTIYNVVHLSGAISGAFSGACHASVRDGVITVAFGDLIISFSVDIPDAGGPETAQVKLPDGTILIYP